jgi:hypothetical protein
MMRPPGASTRCMAAVGSPPPGLCGERELQSGQWQRGIRFRFRGAAQHNLFAVCRRQVDVHHLDRRQLLQDDPRTQPTSFSRSNS